MTHIPVQSLLVETRCTVREAMIQMDSTARGILLLVNAKGRLLRTITDGDLRRAALVAPPELQTLAVLPEIEPITTDSSSDHADVLALMNRHEVDHIPIVDVSQKPIDVIVRREITKKTWLSTPHLGDEEIAFVDQAFKTNWIAPLGPHVDAFESELASLVGIGHAAAVSSGTAAIHLGLILLDVRPDDTVFCSSLTFVGSTNPILYCGAHPVLIDSEPQSWNMSPTALEQAFIWAKKENRLPKCVIIVNLYGQSADMDALVPICEKYGVPILEDAAESLGATYKARNSGTFGRIAVYSFNGNKIITTSGGGMLVSDDASLVTRARKLSTQAREPAKHYEHTEVGFNYRMSNVLAGIGRGQLKVLAARVQARRAVFERYRSALHDIPDVQWMPEPAGSQSTRWLSCFILTGEHAHLRSQKIMAHLERHNIEARPVWKPMHLQPLFRTSPYFSHASQEDVSARLFDAGICVPSGSNMSAANQDEVIARLRDALKVWSA